MARHKEPDFIRWWRAPCPECCHTCEGYQENGVCIVYNQEPPEEFAATIGACKDYYPEIPF